MRLPFDFDGWLERVREHVWRRRPRPHTGAALSEHRTPDAAGAIDTLARTLYGEARGEPVRGLEAVAAVVANRVRKARAAGGYWWGSTVEGVCRRPMQFSCWNADDPNRPVIEAVAADDPVFACCLRIARRAVAGALADPTAGATHYHAKGIRPGWAEGRVPSARIGNHVFYADVE